MNADESMEAVRPFHVAGKYLIDAEGSFILICEEGRECGAYSEERINKAGRHFMCPQCGRIDLRMEWATPENCRMGDK